MLWSSMDSLQERVSDVPLPEEEGIAIPSIPATAYEGLVLVAATDYSNGPTSIKYWM